jgi:hypothetical protein
MSHYHLGSKGRVTHTVSKVLGRWVEEEVSAKPTELP